MTAPPPGEPGDLHARIDIAVPAYTDLAEDYAAAIQAATADTLDQVAAALDPIMNRADQIIDGLRAELDAHISAAAASAADGATGFAAAAAMLAAEPGLTAYELAARAFEQEPPHA